jgi:hypothetical protein
VLTPSLLTLSEPVSGRSVPVCALRHFNTDQAEVSAKPAILAVVAPGIRSTQYAMRSLRAALTIRRKVFRCFHGIV